MVGDIAACDSSDTAHCLFALVYDTGHKKRTPGCSTETS